MSTALLFIGRYWKKMQKPLFQNILATLCITASYAAVARVIHSFLQPEKAPIAQLLFWLSLIFLLFLTYFFVIRCYAKNSMQVGHTISTDIRLRLYNHLRKLPLSFFKKRISSKISRTLLDDMIYTESVFSVYIYEMAVGLIIPIILLVILALLDWRLATGVLGSILLALPFLYKSYINASQSSLKFIDARANVDHTLQEYLEGIRELKGANRTGGGFRPFVEQNDALQKMSSIIESRLGFYGQTYIGVLECTLVVMFAGGALLVTSNAMSIAILVFSLCMSNRIIEPLQLLGAFLTEFRFALGALKRVSDIFYEKPLPVLSKNVKPTDFGFSFKLVSFSYDGEKAIEDISFDAPEGTVTALVGESGSGKTTITNLLLRFWEADRGEICIGGADIRAMEQEELYSLFSVVFQDVYLFNDTVMNNIRLGRPDASDEDVMEAAKQAYCHEFIMNMEKGYDTPVGQNGAMLSGGERQRLAIARAVLVKAPILLLDEATASIDSENELQIQQGLNNLIQGRTLLVIAHRLSTIRYADQILVVKKGKIVERGTHDQLIAWNGAYKALWEAQESMKSWTIRENKEERNDHPHTQNS